jgi:hypothetical protein
MAKKELTQLNQDELINLVRKLEEQVKKLKKQLKSSENDSSFSYDRGHIDGFREGRSDLKKELRLLLGVSEYDPNDSSTHNDGCCCGECD